MFTSAPFKMFTSVYRSYKYKPVPMPINLCSHDLLLTCSHQSIKQNVIPSILACVHIKEKILEINSIDVHIYSKHLVFTSVLNGFLSTFCKNVYTKDAHVDFDGRCRHMLFYRPEGKVMFSQVFVCPQSASWLLVHCSSLLPRAVGTHPTGMLSCFNYESIAG